MLVITSSTTTNKPQVEVVFPPSGRKYQRVVGGNKGLHD